MDEAGVKELLIDLLELEGEPDWANLNAESCDEWDSLVHMAIVDEVELALQRQLDPVELMGLTSYSAVVAVLRGRSGRAD